LWVARTNGVNVVIRTSYRYLTPDGEIKEGQFDTPPFSSSFVQLFPLYEGWLLSLAARIITFAAAGQWGFLQFFVVRATTNVFPTEAHELIWQGYIPANTLNGWPGTPAKEITDGAGTIRSITGTTPAAGAEISETVPANRRWTLLTLRAALTTSAAVANRLPALTLSDGSNIIFAGSAFFTQTASNSVAYSPAPYAVTTTALAGGVALNLILPVGLKAGFKIITNTTGLQAGDQWSAPQYVVQEWGMFDP